MANLGQSFNVNDAPEVSFDPIPAGNYIAMITNSEIKTSKTSGANYLNLTLEIIEGDKKGRLIWHILNLWHQNEKPQNIARAELAKIQEAVGITDVQDSAELHNKPMLVKVVIEPGRDKYNPSNKIKGFKAASAKAPAPQTPAKEKPWEAPAKTEEEIW